MTGFATIPDGNNMFLWQLHFSISCIFVYKQEIAELGLMFSAYVCNVPFYQKTISYDCLSFLYIHFNSLFSEINASNFMFLRWKTLFSWHLFGQEFCVCHLLAWFSFSASHLSLLYFTGQLLPQHMLFSGSSKHVSFF